MKINKIINKSNPMIIAEIGQAHDGKEANSSGGTNMSLRNSKKKRPCILSLVERVICHALGETTEKYALGWCRGGSRYVEGWK